MHEATGRTEMERRLIERSPEDDAFRQQLLADPRTAVEQELGTRLPEDLRVLPWKRPPMPFTSFYLPPRKADSRTKDSLTRISVPPPAAAPGSTTPAAGRRRAAADRRPSVAGSAARAGCKGIEALGRLSAISDWPSAICSCLRPKADR